MIRTIITAAALAGGIFAATPAVASAPAPHGVIKSALTNACEYEDSANCYWDARSMGNGRGHSFYSIKVGHRICTVYWDRAYNRRHGFCS